jgi:hypothetical protein
MRRSVVFALAASALTCTSCDPRPKADAPAAPATEPKTSAASEKQPAPAPEPKAAPEIAAPPQPKAEPSLIDLANLPSAIDLNGFGSDEPLERPDLPRRGVITFGKEMFQHMNGAHWETYYLPFKAKRWGRYQVRLTYSLNRASLGMQFRLGDLTVKKPLLSAPQPRKMYLGEAYISAAGEVPISLLTPPSEGSGFTIHELALIPAPEGEPVAQADDGSITLPARSATTWSVNMRYEPKPEKDCLGYWTEPDDFAEWEFEVQKPGRYKVAVVHGCGGGNHGSEVEVRQDGQALKFTTQDTGGFQNWQEVQVGEIEIKKPGRQRLAIDPVNKVKSAVLDVHKVVLTPVS